ncbi:MAG: glycosyltransferase family 4 protein [Candidatus Odinarchaeum yellowstonii]|uniref:Glycosyltransferase family 4 protein n=1 Tax=Odinarchaeota yellowstonii (strain LCB_4) TaxID=1841599 RepID=A0AAF0IBG3_ODILC|nr:MAG: glycosyltransferase family 4 protein [Candidatus Odinarchaeum yellowstonii]
MNLLMLANITLPPSTGDAVHFLELARHFSEKGLKVTLILPKPLTAFKINLKIQHHFYRRFNFPVLGSFLNLLAMTIAVLKICASKKFDAIYLRQATFFFIINFVSKILKLPVFFEVNGLYSYEEKMRGGGAFKVWFYRFLDDLAIRKAKGVICVSGGLYKYALNIKRSPKNILSSTNAVDLELFNKKFDYLTIREKYKFGENAILIFIGNLTPWYDFNILLEAMKIIRGKRSDVKLLIVGRGVLEKEIKNEIIKKGLDNVTMIGAVPHSKIPELLSVSEIGLLPLKKTPHNLFVDIPVKVLEYFAAGKPVISYNVGGISKVVINDYTGFLIPNNSPHILAEKILYLLNNPERKKILGLNARKLCAEKYSWNNVAKQIVDFINLIIQNNFK